MIYVFFGGSSSSIYNEVIRFFLIRLGLLPVVFIGLHAVGGFEGLVTRIPPSFMHAWQHMDSASDIPMGVDRMGMILGFGLVQSFFCRSSRLFRAALRRIAAHPLPKVTGKCVPEDASTTLTCYRRSRAVSLLPETSRFRPHSRKSDLPLN